MDNLSVHKVRGILRPLFDKKIEVIFLPPYSPDFSPIENFWNEIKIVIRKAKIKKTLKMLSVQLLILCLLKIFYPILNILVIYTFKFKLLYSLDLYNLFLFLYQFFSKDRL
jgi:transposase